MSTDYSRNELSTEKHVELIFNASHSVIPIHVSNQGFLEIYEEFISYKKISADLGNIPIPPEHIQKEYCSAVDLFGKEKPNHFPRLNAKKEKIHHLHVFDGKTDAELENWSSKQQSRRSCDTLIFYSYFEHDDKFYFYILKFIESPKGHEFQSNSQEMLQITNEAEKYRQSIVNTQK